MTDMIQISQTGLSELRTIMESPVFDDINRGNQAKKWRNAVNADWIDNFMNRMHEISPQGSSAELIDDKTGQAHTVESMVENLRDRVRLDALEKSAAPDTLLEVLPVIEEDLDVVTEVDGEPIELDTQEDPSDEPIAKLEKFLDENSDVRDVLKGLLNDDTQKDLGAPYDYMKPVESALGPAFLSKSMIIEAASKKKDPSLKWDIDQFIEDHYTSHRGYADAPSIIYALRDKYSSDIVREYKDFIDKKIEEAKDKHKGEDMRYVLPSPYMGSPMKSDPQGDKAQPLFENIKNL